MTDAYYLWVLLPVILILLYVPGIVLEKKHYRSILNRERAYLHLPAVTSKTPPYPDHRIVSAKLVYGSAVISVNYLRRFFAGICRILGGRVKSYENMLDRARREAILRMKGMARNASIIINVRIDTSSIGNTTCIEAIAYGTEIVVED